MKSEIINKIIEAEGGYVNDSRDSGGETMCGITKAVALTYGYDGEMRKLPKETAFQIYADRYWNSVRGDDIVELSPRIAKEVVDTAVNMGQGQAGMFLQRSLNALNKNGSLYPDMFTDGIIGSKTIAALTKYLEKRSEDVLLKALNCLQGAYYISLTEERQKDESFLYGWLKNRVEL
jgi:lysozyme family protein